MKELNARELETIQGGIGVQDFICESSDMFITSVPNKYIAYNNLEEFKNECYAYLLNMKPNTITKDALLAFKNMNKVDVATELELAIERLVASHTLNVKSDSYVAFKDRQVRLIVLESLNCLTIVLSMIHSFNKAKRNREAIPALNSLTNKVIPKGYTKIKNSKTKEIAISCLKVSELEYSDKLTSDLAMSFSSYILNLRDITKTNILGDLKYLANDKLLLLFKVFEEFLRFNRTLTSELILEDFINRFSSDTAIGEEVGEELGYLSFMDTDTPLYMKLKDLSISNLFGESLEPKDVFYIEIAKGNPNSKRIIVVKPLEPNKNVEHLLGAITLNEMGDQTLIKMYKEDCLPEYQCIKYPEEYYHSNDVSFLIELLTGKLD